MNDVLSKNHEDFNTAFKSKLTELSIAPDMERGDYINVTNERIPVKTEKARHYSNYAKEILAKMNDGEFNDYEFTQVLLFGGGSFGIKEYLRAAISEKYQGKTKQIDRFKLDEINPEGQKYNALGYMKYGIYS